jgi:hypothetical protein
MTTMKPVRIRSPRRPARDFRTQWEHKHDLPANGPIRRRDRICAPHGRARQLLPREATFPASQAKEIPHA